MNKILIIETCDECCHFSNEYYGYSEICRKLDIKIESKNGAHEIPENCPLQNYEGEK